MGFAIFSINSLKFKVIRYCKILTIKISYLIYLLETIDRDISELEKYDMQLPTDRSYALNLKKTLNEEVNKLKKQRSSILSLEVELPYDKVHVLEKDLLKVKNEYISKEGNWETAKPFSFENSNVNQVYDNIDSKKIKNAHRY
ncbi:MAG: hypothetical protein H7A23_15805 [Leptospiraceae bacterium]|nr:hypothetical protein [Leptospiraceae bacterium]MCP5496014.1 hypothetical protein [Leptospiraceae bacterium]